MVLPKKPAGDLAPGWAIRLPETCGGRTAVSVQLQIPWPSFKLKPNRATPPSSFSYPIIITLKKNFHFWKWPCWAEAHRFKGSLGPHFEKSLWTLDWLSLEGGLNLVHLGAQKRRVSNLKASIASCLFSLLTFFSSSPARLRWLK